MPEPGDYEPYDWSADTNFSTAKVAYDQHVGRSYADAKAKKLPAANLVEEFLSTTALAPVVCLIDETSSMGEWPSVIFSKLGYLAHETEFYFGKDYAICFGAFGDATPSCNEQYAVQMRPFAHGADLPVRLNELVHEKGGGGQKHESAELCLLYVDRKIDAPNAIRPILLIITDEMAYQSVDPDQAKRWCKIDLTERVSTKDLIESLKTKWSVYVILKPYDDLSEGRPESSDNRTIRQSWEKLVGEDHVLPLPDAARVVDVIFGIFGNESGKYDAFVKELNARQLPDKGGKKKVDTTLTATARMRPKQLAAPDATKKGGAHGSTTRRPGDATAPRTAPPPSGTTGGAKKPGQRSLRDDDE